MSCKEQVKEDMVFLEDQQRLEREEIQLEDIVLFRCKVPTHPNFYGRVDDHILACKGISNDCPVCRWLKFKEQLEKNREELLKN